METLLHSLLTQPYDIHARTWTYVRVCRQAGRQAGRQVCVGMCVCLPACLESKNVMSFVHPWCPANHHADMQTSRDSVLENGVVWHVHRTSIVHMGRDDYSPVGPPAGAEIQRAGF